MYFPSDAAIWIEKGTQQKPKRTDQKKKSKWTIV